MDAALRAVTAQVSSNEAFPRGHQYILIFDQQHITPGNEQRARMAAEQFIRRQVRPSDRVALFGVPGPGPQLGFTADKMRALEGARVHPRRLSAHGRRRHSARSASTRRIASCRGTSGSRSCCSSAWRRRPARTSSAAATARDRRAAPAAVRIRRSTRRVLIENARTIVNQSDAESRQFLQRLADVITQFRDIEGRKTVVLFSEGFFQDNLSRELEAVAAAAAQSYCVFYTFDLNQRTSGRDRGDVSRDVARDGDPGADRAAGHARGRDRRDDDRRRRGPHRSGARQDRGTGAGLLPGRLRAVERGEGCSAASTGASRSR